VTRSLAFKERLYRKPQRGFAFFRIFSHCSSRNARGAMSCVRLNLKAKQRRNSGPESKVGWGPNWQTPRRGEGLLRGKSRIVAGQREVPQIHRKLDFTLLTPASFTLSMVWRPLPRTPLFSLNELLALSLTRGRMAKQSSMKDLHWHEAGWRSSHP
jgi:hypothetical protein